MTYQAPTLTAAQRGLILARLAALDRIIAVAEANGRDTAVEKAVDAYDALQTALDRCGDAFAGRATELTRADFFALRIVLPGFGSPVANK